MKKAEKILSLVLAFSFLMTIFSVAVTAEITSSGTCDGEITSTDYLQIKRYFLGTLDLYA